jgi:NAD(P)-dependent dehydrogenase (short-subunit alcohol dehydrogenase family)
MISHHTAFELADAVCVVTGASSGLGRRFALDLALGGAAVIGIARRDDLLASLQSQLEGISGAGKSRAQKCDVSDVESYLSVLASVEAANGRIDLLINCAGTGEPVIEGRSGGSRVDLSPSDLSPALEAYRSVMETNFFAAVAGTLFVLPGMLDRRHGAIVNVSSDSARAPGPGEPIYCASKSALSAFTECQALAAVGSGVHIHVLYPGWVPTAMGTKAIDRGMPMPPRYVRRTEVGVSRLLMRRIGSDQIDIDAAPVARLAPVARSLMPGAYKRGVLKSSGHPSKSAPT